MLNNKSTRRFIRGIIILSLGGYWLYQSDKVFDWLAYSLLGIIGLAAAFDFYFGLRALTDEKNGVFYEDELSEKIRTKAAAIAFKSGVFLWLFIELFLLNYLDISSTRDAKILVALGMVCMVLIYLFSWVYLLRTGISDEN